MLDKCMVGNNLSCIISPGYPRKHPNPGYFETFETWGASSGWGAHHFLKKCCAMGRGRGSLADLTGFRACFMKQTSSKTFHLSSWVATANKNSPACGHAGDVWDDLAN